MSPDRTSLGAKSADRPGSHLLGVISSKATTRSDNVQDNDREDLLPHFKSLPENAGPASVFTKYPDIYRPWSEMSQVLMNGASPLSQGEREMILAYAAGVAGCTFVYVAHSAVAYAWGIKQGLIEQLLEDFDAAALEPRLRPLMAFVRKLMATPGQVSQQDADAVFDAGWSEQALHDAIAVTARAAFMQRLVQGHGFTPMTPERAAERAEQRIELGYVDLFAEFKDAKRG